MVRVRESKEFILSIRLDNDDIDKPTHYDRGHMNSVTAMTSDILFGFYGISTLRGYLLPTPLNTYILNIYDL